MSGIVQRKCVSIYSTNSPTTTLAQTTVVGNAMFVLAVSGQTNPPQIVVDNAAGGSNTWTQVLADTGGVLNTQVWALANAPKAFSTFTIGTNLNPELHAMAFWEINGAATVTPNDVIHAGQGSSGNSASSGSSGTPSASTDIALDLTGWLRTDSSVTQDSGYTFTQGVPDLHAFANNTGAGVSYSASANDLVLTSGAAQTFTSTLVAANFWASIICLVKITAGGPANLKTATGLAKASIKTFDGVAIASVKKVDGLS